MAKLSKKPKGADAPKPGRVRHRYQIELVLWVDAPADHSADDRRDVVETALMNTIDTYLEDEVELVDGYILFDSFCSKTSEVLP